MSVDSTLAEREARYGGFSNNASYAQGIKEIMRASKSWPLLTAVQREALELIASKLGRLLSGDPAYVDNWHDIGGYAKLAEDHLGEMKCPADTTPNTSSDTRKPPSRSKSEKLGIRPDTTSSEQEKCIRGTASTSTTEDLLRRVAATDHLIGGSDPGILTDPKGI